MQRRTELTVSSGSLKYSESSSVGIFLFKHTQSSRSTFSICSSNDMNGGLEMRLSRGRKLEDNVCFGTEIWDIMQLKKLNVLMRCCIGCVSFVEVRLGCNFYRYIKVTPTSNSQSN